MKLDPEKIDSMSINETLIKAISIPKKPVSLRRYLKSIDDVVLPERFSKVTKDFVDFVVNIHSWYKGLKDESLIGVNFYISPEPLKEREASKDVVYQEFGNLNYGVPTLPHFSVKNQIPREIYDAGLAIVDSNYKSNESQRIMVATIANMLDAINEYRTRRRQKF